MKFSNFATIVTDSFVNYTLTSWRVWRIFMIYQKSMRIYEIKKNNIPFTVVTESFLDFTLEKDQTILK